jgi:hypothetical protein
MRRLLAPLLIAGAVAAGLLPALAQDAQTPQDVPDANTLQTIITTEIPQERMDLAMQLVRLSGSSAGFDELLPNIADQAKNAFIRANPQMQLGIIEVVDRIALSLVNRRPELDTYLARVWASAFTDEEMQDLIDFFSTDTGKKYGATLPRLLAVQMASAEYWGRSVGDELTQKVADELRATMQAEQNALTGGGAETPAPQEQPAEEAPAQ